jgi:tRNA (guanine-N7-)-methyltransferase
MDWDTLYPAYAGSGRTPEFADVGCGFGGRFLNPTTYFASETHTVIVKKGLLTTLAPLYPDTLMLG